MAKKISRVSDNFDCDFIWPHVDIDKFSDFENFCEKVERSPIDAYTKEMNRVANEFIRKNRGRERYQRLRDVDLRCSQNALMMLTPPSSGQGYLTARDQRLWNFLVEFRNALAKEIDEEQLAIADTMLMNPAKRLPAVVEITQNKLFFVNKEYYPSSFLRAACEAYDFVMNIGFHAVTPDIIALKNKKTTSPGFPFETVDGIPVRRDDITYGREEDAEMRKTRFILDWSEVKKGWRENLDKGCLSIFRNQIEFINAGGKVDPSNLGTCIENNIISVHNNALRQNCPDAPLDSPMVRKDAYGMYSKNRKATIFTEDEQIDILMDSKKVNSILDSELGMPGLCNRQRKIMPSNNMMHTMGTVLATATVWMAEEGRKGNPSTRPAVLSDYNDFSYKMRKKGYHINVFSGDCSNAEVTVTTNFKLFMELVPDRFRRYLDLTSHSVIPYKNWFRFMENGYCSAVWYTTWFHILKGNFECARMTWFTLKHLGYKVDPFEDCIKRCIYLLFLSSEHPELLRDTFGDKFDPDTCSISFGDDCWYNPKLATDDMVCQVATRNPIEQIPDVVQKIAEECMLDWEKGPVIAFGMHMDENEMKENVGSRFAKLFTGEHMGFTYKDGMSTYVKLSECGHTDLANFMLHKHFGFGVEDYSTYVTKFASWLRDLGVQDGFYNEYSPSERLLFGKYIGAGGSLGEVLLENIRDKNSPIKFLRGSYADQVMTRSSRVPDEVVTTYLKEIDNAFYS